jgi:hypothetical protein
MSNALIREPLFPGLSRFALQHMGRKVYHAEEPDKHYGDHLSDVKREVASDVSSDVSSEEWSDSGSSATIVSDGERSVTAVQEHYRR